MFGAQRLSSDQIAAAAAGDSVALEHVVTVLEPQVRLMIAARLSPTPVQLDAVDDLAQDTLMELTRAVRRLQNRTVAGLRSFVSVIASRKVFAYLRRANRPAGGVNLRSLDSTVGSFSQAGPLWQLLSGSTPSPSFLAVRGEQVAILLAELGKLEERNRRVITLAVFDQLGPTEIGTELGISPNAASHLLVRATRKLRQNVARGMTAVAHHD